MQYSKARASFPGEEHPTLERLVLKRVHELADGMHCWPEKSPSMRLYYTSKLSTTWCSCACRDIMQPGVERNQWTDFISGMNGKVRNTYLFRFSPMTWKLLDVRTQVFPKTMIFMSFLEASSSCICWFCAKHEVAGKWFFISFWWSLKCSNESITIEVQ